MPSDNVVAGKAGYAVSVVPDRPSIISQWVLFPAKQREGGAAAMSIFIIGYGADFVLAVLEIDDPAEAKRLSLESYTPDDSLVGYMAVPLTFPHVARARSLAENIARAGVGDHAPPFDPKSEEELRAWQAMIKIMVRLEERVN